MQRQHQQGIEDIIRAIDQIEQYLGAESAETFLLNFDLQEIALQRLQRIEAAARQLPDEFKSQHREIDWERFNYLKETLVSWQSGVDLQGVWKVIQEDIYPLRDKLREIIEADS